MGNCCVADEIQGGPPVPDNNGIARKEKDNDIETIGAPKATTEPTRKKKYSKKQPIKLGYWKIRGLAQPIRYLLEFSEHPYVEIQYE